ncbi:MAG TPA: DNA-3-methyladenine glycosylase 2 family protein [Thermoanaerobaculia bacterium]
MNSFTIVPARPYSLALTAARYTRFPEAVDLFDGRAYRRLLLPEAGRRGAALVSVTQRGGPDRAVLEVTLEGPGAASPDAAEAARRLVVRALGASSDLAAFYAASAADPLLAASIRDFRGLRIAGHPSLWEALVTAILCQQVNLRFAYDIRRELALALGRRARIAGAVFVDFPAPRAVARLTPRELRRFRLSRNKAVAIGGLARAFAGGALSEETVSALPDEAAIEALTHFAGVGRWTAEIALLRGLGRIDIFPAGDLGVVKYLAVGLLGRSARAKEDEMRRFAERWRPHRGFALVYAYAELSRRQAAQKEATKQAAEKAKKLSPAARSPGRAARPSSPPRRGSARSRGR